MPLDAVCLSALSQELSSQLLGCRIDKIHQPSRDEVLLSFRGGEGNLRLLLSASPSRPRAQLTRLPRENPAQPPMFCMLLRKHFAGAKLLEIVQPPLERLLRFVFETSNELGDRVQKELILEAMGKHSNLIVMDTEGRIVDCLRRVSQDMSAERQVLPGMFYRLPPNQGKHNLLLMNQTERQNLAKQLPQGIPMDSCFVQWFAGISPLIARELSLEIGGASDALVSDHAPQMIDTLLQLLRNVSKGQYSPHMLLRQGKPVDFSFRPLWQYGTESESIAMLDFATLLDSFYAERESYEHIRQKGQTLIRTVTSARDRVVRKLGFQKKEWLDTQNRESLREKGDLITANLYRLEKGLRQFETENFYDPDCAPVRITLDPLLTPQQNATRYYKQYQKAKTAEAMLTEQIAKGEKEAFYLQSVLESLALAEGVRDLDEIRQEMELGGYIRSQSKQKGRQKPKKIQSKLLECQSSTGFRISVGRNNTQNDMLTCRMASRGDIWFHVQGIHGAHVILWTEGQEVDVQSMTEAASLAAWFSQGRGGNKIPVDYTPVRYVKKPAGAKPGMVIYTTYETAYVSPTAEEMDALLHPSTGETENGENP